MARIILPKRWSRARRKSARAVIRYDVMKMQRFALYDDMAFRRQSEAWEQLSQQIAEALIAEGGMPFRSISREALKAHYGED